MPPKRARGRPPEKQASSSDASSSDSSPSRPAKSRVARNTVISMPPTRYSTALLRPRSKKTASSRVPVHANETCSTLDPKPKTFDGIVNEIPPLKSDDAKSPLLEMPAELMEMILELALISDGPIKISKLRRHPMPGILQVNSKIRNSGLKMYYSNNDFRAIFTGEYPDGSLKWAVDIASANLRYIPCFTFEFRFTVLDFQRWYLRLSRTDAENLESSDELSQMCESARAEVVASLFKFRDLEFDLAKVRLHVDVSSQDIPTRLNKDRDGLRLFLKTHIVKLIVVVEAITAPISSSAATSPNHLSARIRQGRTIRSTRDCWDMVI